MHELAAKAREKGDLPAALGFVFQAEEAYRRDADVSLLIAARHFAEISVDLAREADNEPALALAYFNLGKCQEALGELRPAVDSFQKAYDIITSNPPPRHNRPAVVSDFKLHLAVCRYRTQDKSALQLAEEALRELASAQGASDYEHKVWVSGAHMDIARMLIEDDPEKARRHLEQARQIIDADENLVVRKKQWERLTRELEK